MICTSCSEERDDVDRRYSFGIYAGRLCEECCRHYRDHCGLDQEQGAVEDLAEFEARWVRCCLWRRRLVMNEHDLFVLICLCIAAFNDASTVYSSRIDGLLLPNDNLLLVL